MEYSQALQNAQSLSDVVEIINDDGTSLYTPHHIAAQYAHNAADEAGYGISKDNIEAHFDVLVDAGAMFDYQQASDLALIA